MIRKIQLLLIAIFTFVGMTKAQHTLTVYEDASSRAYATPVSIFNFSSYTRSQFVIPASELTAMNDGKIYVLRFYASNTNYPEYLPYASDCDVDVYIKEVGYTSMTTFESKASSTIVYQGKFSIEMADGDGELTITLNTPYTYHGGNLLIGMENTTKSQVGKLIYFVNKAIDGQNYYPGLTGYNSNSLDAVTPTQIVRVPKTTFHYTLGSEVYRTEPASLTMTDISKYRASVGWAAPAGSSGLTGYVYQYKKASESSWSPEQSITATSVTLTGLTPNTAYIFRVKAMYGSVSSVYATMKFTTDTAERSLPYAYPFEKLLDYRTMVDYWTLMDCNSQTRVTSTHHEGDFSFCFVQGSTSPQYLISPEFDGTSALTVSFWYKNAETLLNAYSETFQVGYSTTTRDPGAFTWESEMTISDPVWTRYEHNYPSGTKYIAIQYTSVNKLGLHIDDFSAEEYNGYAKPANVMTDYATSSTAKVAWTAPAGGVTGYGYQYKKTTDESWSTEVSVTTTSATISGLTPYTDYEFRVRAQYGSNWSSYAKINFTTAYQADFPFTDGFEDGLRWTMVDCALSPQTTGIKTDAKRSGSNGFDFIYKQSGPQYLISPEFNGGSAVFVSFWYRAGYANYSETFQVGYSTTTNAPSAFIWGSAFTTSDTQWKQYGESFPAGTKYVAVRHDPANLSHLFLDDFSFVASSDFFRPAHLTMSTVTPNSATASWTPPSGSVTAYVYQYKKASEEAWSDEMVVTTTSATLSGLTENTDYDFRVKVRYSGGDSEFVALDFTTSASIPFMEGFENGLGSWIIVNGFATNYYATGLGNYSKYEGDYAFEFRSSDTPPQYLISPMLDGSAAMLFSFWYRNGHYSYPAQFQVGYSEKTNDSSDFSWGDAITAEGSRWTLYEGNIPAGTKYVAIKYNSDYISYLYIDNLCVENANYPKPASLAVAGLTTNSATVSWAVPSGEVTGYVYQYKTTSEAMWSDEVTMTATSVPFSGLPEKTSYDFRVKAIYDDGESIWVTTHFTTLRNVVYLPYTEGFENDLNGWTMVDCITDSDTPTGIYPIAKHDGDNGFRFTFTTVPPQYLISPELDDASAIKVKFWYKCASTAQQTFQVGYSATTQDPDAFIWGDELTTSSRFWASYEGGFPKGTKYIAIKEASYDKRGLYIDDISIEATAYLEAVQPAHTLAAVSWAGESDSYKVRCRTSVKRGNMLLSKNFENNSLGDWTTANLKSGSGVSSNVGVGNGYGFAFSTSSSVGYTQYQYLISPALSGISDAVELNFYYRNANASKPESFKVGYSTTTNATNAFSGNESPTISVSADTDWHLYQLVLPADVKYIAIEVNGRKQALYVDDISIYNWAAGPWTTITTTDHSAVMTGLTPGTAYEIQVIGVKDGVEDSGTAITSFTTLTADDPLELADGANNTALIEAENGFTCDVVLSGRTLYKDGGWNTLCLPFDVTLEGSPLAGATARQLQSAQIVGTTLHLTFNNSETEPVTMLRAGVPYIIKWENDTEHPTIINPTFTNVLVKAEHNDYDNDATKAEEFVRFIGTYSAETIDTEDESILFMGGDDKLYYPDGSTAITIGAFRAYFKIGEDESLARRITRFYIDFGEDVTEIVSLSQEERGAGMAEGWYTLDGRKLSGKPTTKGLYIHAGKKVMMP